MGRWWGKGGLNAEVYHPLGHDMLRAMGAVGGSGHKHVLTNCFSN